MRTGGFIYTRTDKRVIYICKAYHLHIQWDFVPFETIRISVAIDPLMVVQADFTCMLHKRGVGKFREFFKNLCACSCMSFHDFKFVRSQFSRFQQNLIGNGDFSDVMKNGSVSYGSDFGCLNLQFRIPYHDMGEQHIGQVLHFAQVLVGFVITEFHQR